MKTLIILENSVAFTGAFRCAIQEAHMLSENVRVVFVVPTGSSVIPYIQEQGFTYYTLPYKEISRSISALLLYPLYLVRNSISLHRIVKKEKASWIQVNDFYNLLGAVMKCTGYRGKLWTWVRFLPIVIPKPLRRLWIGAAMRWSDHIIAVSDAVKNQLPEHEKIKRIYDPVVLSEKHELMARNSSRIECLYLANYIQGKGQDYALEAFALAYRENPKLRLRFAGGDMGLQKNRLYKNKLIQRAQELQLTDKVTFNTFCDDVEKAIKSADIFLNFSDAESFSLTCLEASYYGTPVIATRCGGPEEIIAHEQSGILVPRGDIHAMKDALLYLAQHDHIRRQFAAYGKKYVQEKFSQAIFQQEMKTLLNDSE